MFYHLQPGDLIYTGTPEGVGEIALRLKGLDVEYVPVDLRSEQHLGHDYKARNPQGLVPALMHGARC